jgi:hypothetical protein
MLLMVLIEQHLHYLVLKQLLSRPPQLYFKTPVPLVKVKCYLQGYHLNIINDFCAGNNISLEVQTDYTSGVNYSWTGPYGFTRSERVPKMSNISATNEGCIELDSNLLNRLYSHSNNNLSKVFPESYRVSPFNLREKVLRFIKT